MLKLTRSKRPIEIWDEMHSHAYRLKLPRIQENFTNNNGFRIGFSTAFIPYITRVYMYINPDIPAIYIRHAEISDITDKFIMEMVADYNKYFKLTDFCKCNSIRLCEDCIKKARTIISF